MKRFKLPRLSWGLGISYHSKSEYGGPYLDIMIGQWVWVIGKNPWKK